MVGVDAQRLQLRSTEEQVQRSFSYILWKLLQGGTTSAWNPARPTVRGRSNDVQNGGVGRTDGWALMRLALANLRDRIAAARERGR